MRAPFWIPSRYRLLVFLPLLIVASGCSSKFFDIPPDTAAARAEIEPKWADEKPYGKIIPDFTALDCTIEELSPIDEESPPAQEHWTLAVQFLHISDAQIRDEGIYSDADLEYKKSLKSWATIKPEANRPFLERFDSLVLAAFLSAGGKTLTKQSSSNDNRPIFSPFIIHTGDLLDISLTTEMIDCGNILRDYSDAYTKVPLFLVPGNHDGLTFGCIGDPTATTYNLGINKAEFVNSCLVFDPIKGRGFGFGKNELVKFFAEGNNEVDADLSEVYYFPSARSPKELLLLIKELFFHSSKAVPPSKVVSEFTNDLKKFFLHKANSNPARVSSELKTHVNVNSHADQVGPKTGYYSWIDNGSSSPDIPGIRYIVLDTRGRVGDEGYVDPVQLGWLYEQLLSSQREKQLVIVFGHHPLSSDWESPARHSQILVRLLTSFPNVVAYFNGHTHVNEVPTRFRGPNGRSVVEITTGSLIDPPQVGRSVKVYLLPKEGDSSVGTVRVESTFVRPKIIDPNGEDTQVERRRTTVAAALKKSESYATRKRDRRGMAKHIDKYLSPAYGPDVKALSNPEYKTPVEVPYEFFKFLPVECRPEAIFSRELPLVKEARGKLLGDKGEMFEQGWSLQDKDTRSTTTLYAQELKEASGVAVLDDGRLVVASDGKKDNPKQWMFYVVDTKENSVEQISFPEFPMDDLEGLTPTPGGGFAAICSQSRTKGKGKVKKERNRFAVFALDKSTEKLSLVRKVEDFRSALIEHLRTINDHGGVNQQQLAYAHAGDGGLNIEALASRNDAFLVGLESPKTADGQSIILEFRLHATNDSSSSIEWTKTYFLNCLAKESIVGMDTGKDGKVLVLLSMRNPSSYRIVEFDPSTGTKMEVPFIEKPPINNPEAIGIRSDNSFYVLQDTTSPDEQVIFKMTRKTP